MVLGLFSPQMLPCICNCFPWSNTPSTHTHNLQHLFMRFLLIILEALYYINCPLIIKFILLSTRKILGFVLLVYKICSSKLTPFIIHAFNFYMLEFSFCHLFSSLLWGGYNLCKHKNLNYLRAFSCCVPHSYFQVKVRSLNLTPVYSMLLFLNS